MKVAAASEAAAKTAAARAPPATRPAVPAPSSAPTAPPSRTALDALEQLQHPSMQHPNKLVPTLRAALESVAAARRGPAAAAPASALAPPLLLGVASFVVDLLEGPQAASLGPEAPLLVLELLSHLGAPAPGSRQAPLCTALWRRAHIALGDAADQAGHWSLLAPNHMSSGDLVRYYEAAARCAFAGAPSKSRGLGLLLRAHLHAGAFTSDEAVRLLAAWATLRRRMPFNPDSYNFTALAAQLAAAAPSLTADQLQAVAGAAPAFDWPVYRSVPLLHAVCRAAVHRSMAGTLALPVAQWTLAAAVKGAAAMRTCLKDELEEAAGEWMCSAASEASRATAGGAACPLPAHAAALQPMHGAALAAMAAAGDNNIVRAAPAMLGSTQLAV